MLDEWAPSPWKRVPAEGLTSDPLVATILLTTGAPWVEKESKEMAVKVVFIFPCCRPGPTLNRNSTNINPKHWDSLSLV